VKLFQPSFIPAVCWLVISTFLLVIPGNSFPQENWLDKIWFDKWVHIGLFAVMVVLWCRAMLRMNLAVVRRRKLFIFIAGLWLIYGIGMEFVQKYLVVNRSFDAGDIMADAVGCLAGLFYSMRSYIKK